MRASLIRNSLLAMAVIAVASGGAHAAAGIEPARAQAKAKPLPCQEDYPAGHLFSPDDIKRLGPAARLAADAGDAPRQPAIIVSLLKGSINPKQNAAPTGLNMRWRTAIPANARSACLSYHLWLPADFQFNLGGKLPGLFGGDGPAGGRKADGNNGFSTRYMWRRGGAGEIYAYLPGHPVGRGLTIDRGAWYFPRGRWVELAQEVILNTPDASNGTIRVWVDGDLRLQRDGLNFRKTPELGFSGVMADIFYGGKGAEWAAPADTELRITPFDLRWK